MDKEKKRRIAYEVMVFLIVLAIILLITRLWPILLLAIVGILICALRLLFVSVNRITVVKPAPVLVLRALPAPETEQSIIQKSFALLQRRITEHVIAEYPAARWIWSNSNAQENFATGAPLTILLNSAGGYGKAHVLVTNLLFVGLRYEGHDDEGQTEPQTETVSSALHPDTPEPDCEDTSVDEADIPVVNYGRLAFEWVEAHLSDLNEKSNEALANEQYTLLIASRELPHPESWLDVCAELKHNGFADADITADGIKLILPQ